MNQEKKKEPRKKIEVNCRIVVKLCDSSTKNWGKPSISPWTLTTNTAAFLYQQCHQTFSFVQISLAVSIWYKSHNTTHSTVREGGTRQTGWLPWDETERWSASSGPFISRISFTRRAGLFLYRQKTIQKLNSYSYLSGKKVQRERFLLSATQKNKPWGLHEPTWKGQARALGVTPNWT